MMIERRTVLRGAGLMVANSFLDPFKTIAGAAAPASPFIGTSIEDNRIAQMFVPVDMGLPAIPLRSATGMTTLAKLTDKTRIVTLWAEWCAPCLIEARDFAEIARTTASPNFEIVSVLTCSVEKLDHAAAAARLEKAGAAGLPLLVEANGGRKVGEFFSPTPPGADLPCTLLVDRKGRVRGRMMGAPMISTGLPPGVRPSTDGKPARIVLTEEQKKAMMNGPRKSLWSTPIAAAFVAALRDGALRA